MLHSDVRRRLLAAGLALALSVPATAILVSPSQAATEATARETSTFTVLSRGDSGDRVERVQRWLEISRTGYFGKNTYGKVHDFQKRRGLAATGVVNERTWDALKARWEKRGSAYDRVLSVARDQFGDPYVYGAAGPSAFDCSGFTLYVYRQATGMSLPHRATSQYQMGKPISRSEARPGDLVFFHSGGDIYHASIYAGNGDILHVSRPGTVVGRDPIWSSSVYFARLIQK